MENEGALRLIAFLVTFMLMGAGELAAPRRQNVPDRWRRWIGNLGVMAIATVLARVLIPVAPVALAGLVRENDWGLLPHLGLGRTVEWVCTILLLDLALYFQHRVFHASNLLWRLHRMHHADTFFDFTTGVRFHPLEILLSLLYKLALILVLSPPPAAVLTFEIVLNCTAMFNHGNLRLPSRLDGLLRLVVITPDMHRVHHSTNAHEMNSNFGFNCPWWDRLFDTYTASPRLGHDGMEIGLRQFRDASDQSLLRMLWMPWS